MAHAQEPEDVVDTLEEAFERAVELFDAQRFFEAHEFFEHIWKSPWIDSADKDFW
jgi:predicted metal-dependent hydrolase